MLNSIAEYPTIAEYIDHQIHYVPKHTDFEYMSTTSQYTTAVKHLVLQHMTAQNVKYDLQNENKYLTMWNTAHPH